MIPMSKFFDKIVPAPIPFENAGKMWNKKYNEIANGPFAEDLHDNPFYKPLDAIGRVGLSALYATVFSPFTSLPSDDKSVGAGELGLLPDNKMSTNQKKTPGKNAKRNANRRANRRKKQQGERKNVPPPKQRRKEPTKRQGPGRKMLGSSYSTLSAPAAMGTTVPGSNYRFIKSRNYSCMRMINRYFLGTIRITTGGAIKFIITGQSGSGDNGGQWYFNPANSFYVGAGPFATMAALFQKYYLLGLRLTGHSKVPTSTSGTITYGSMDSPSYFESSGVATAVANPSQKLVSEMFSSMTVPVWIPTFTVNFKCNPREEYFVRSQSGTSAAYAYSDDLALAQQCYSHVAGFQYDGPSPSSETAYIDIYLEADIELCDFSSPFTTAPQSLASRLTRLEDEFLIRNSNGDEKKVSSHK